MSGVQTRHFHTVSEFWSASGWSSFSALTIPAESLPDDLTLSGVCLMTSLLVEGISQLQRKLLPNTLSKTPGHQVMQPCTSWVSVSKLYQFSATSLYHITVQGLQHDDYMNNGCRSRSSACYGLSNDKQCNQTDFK